MVVPVDIVSEEVLYAATSTPFISLEDVERLKMLAAENRRKKVRLCIHPDPEALLHEMLIVLARGNYVPPHKHIDKTESFVLIEGEMDVILFDTLGKVTNVIKMGSCESGKVFCFRIPPDLFHSVLVRTRTVVFLETTTGPFRRENMLIAPWAPLEGTEEALAYHEFLKEVVGLA